MIRVAKRTLAILALSTVMGCMGWMPGRQAYWDAKVKEMCEKDGGLIVYQRIRVSKELIDRHVLPMTADGRVGLATKDLAHPEAPVYAIEEVTALNDGGPKVVRTESLIIRRADQVVVGKWVRYSRVGGDLPTGVSHETGFVCPDLQEVASDIHRKLFVIEDPVK